MPQECKTKKVKTTTRQRSASAGKVALKTPQKNYAESSEVCVIGCCEGRKSKVCCADPIK